MRSLRLLAIAICVFGAWSAGADEPVTHRVAIAGFAYVPGQDGYFGQAKGRLPVTLVVRQGDVIEVTNLDPPPIDQHTMTAEDGSFDTGDVFVGATKTIDTSDLVPGDHAFGCFYHPQMAGILRVEGAEDPEPY